MLPQHPKYHIPLLPSGPDGVLWSFVAQDWIPCKRSFEMAEDQEDIICAISYSAASSEKPAMTGFREKAVQYCTIKIYHLHVPDQPFA